MITHLMAFLVMFGLITYIMLDGFDLGTGIILPVMPMERRGLMLNSIAPFWDGNETWLLYVVGLLYAAFPMLYWAILPALYIPLVLMTLCLIVRGISFEFRLKSQNKQERIKWERIFSASSTGTAFFQGMILGSALSGITIVEKHFAGNMFDFLTPLSFACAVAAIFAYATLGTAWQIYKMEKEYINQLLRIFRSLITIMAIIFIFTLPLLHFQRPDITGFILTQKIRLISCIVVSTATVGLFHLLYTQKFKNHIFYFVFTAILFLLPFVEILFALYPYAVPFSHTVHDVINTSQAMKFVVIITSVTLPIILLLTGYNYFIFRGKNSENYYI